MSKYHIYTHIHMYFAKKNDTRDKSNEQTSTEQDAQGSGSTYCRLNKEKRKHTNKSTNNGNSIRNAS